MRRRKRYKIKTFFMIFFSILFLCGASILGYFSRNMYQEIKQDRQIIGTILSEESERYADIQKLINEVDEIEKKTGELEEEYRQLKNE